MKRICLLGAAIAGILIIGVATAMASAPHKSKSSKSAPVTKLTCATSLSLQVPASDTDVTAAAASGVQGGAAVCKPFGKGAEFETFNTDDAGDIVGKWQQWFSTGTIFGTLTLTPSDNSPPTTSTSFSSASYTGTFVIKGGSGAYAKASGKGTETCSTADSIHYSCKDKGKYSLPAAKS